MKKLKGADPRTSEVVSASIQNGFAARLRSKRFGVPFAGVTIILFAVVMSIVLLRSFAASSSASIEPESGTPSGSVTPGQDSRASNGSYVKFNTASGSGRTIFSDDFNGTSVDTTKWDVYDRIGDVGAGQQFCYNPADTFVSNGTAKIVAKHETRSCGDIDTAPQTMPYTVGNLAQKTTPFLYGTIDVRAKMPAGHGLWPLIWMLGYQWQPAGPYEQNIPGSNWPHDGWAEIDISEFWQGARTTVNNTIHYQTAGGLNIHALPFDASSRFMTYRFIWAPGSAIWQVDGEDGTGFRTLYTVTGATNVPDDPMYVLLDDPVGGPGADAIDPATFPQTMEIDYVRITQ